jgi:VRR-NUC domain
MTEKKKSQRKVSIKKAPPEYCTAVSAKMLTEDQEQVKVIDWCHAHPDRRLGLIYHIPNGGKRHIGTAVKMKAAGVKAGVPDLFLPVAIGCFHGLYLEMKALKGGTISKEQKIWIDCLQKEGYQVVVAKGHQMAIGAIEGYLERV